MNEITARFSPHAKISDIVAMLDVYSVQLWMNGLLYVELPLILIQLYEPETTMVDWDSFKIPAVDKTVEVKMVGFAVVGSRWPFYVEYPIEIMFFVGDQWWKYQFTVGRTYMEREMGYK